jgi:hypothetical protein
MMNGIQPERNIVIVDDISGEMKNLPVVLPEAKSRLAWLTLEFLTLL